MLTIKLPHILTMDKILLLPDDVLTIIKEYSMPVTRPDWRTLHKMTSVRYQDDCYIEYAKRFRKIKNDTGYKDVFSGSNFIRLFHWAFYPEN